MKPKQRLVQVMSAALVALAALSACRREVPQPPTPVPERTPKPTVVLTQFAAADLLLAHARRA